jgi:hypothetical protein
MKPLSILLFLALALPAFADSITDLGPETHPRGVEEEFFELRKMKRFIGCAFDFLFGCRHGTISRVFTIRGRTYQVCCDCGATREYSLETMSACDGSRFHSRTPSFLAVIDQ